MSKEVVDRFMLRTETELVPITVLREFHGASSHDTAGRSEIKGALEYRTAAGAAVNDLGDGRYEIVPTGQIGRREE